MVTVTEMTGRQRPGKPPAVLVGRSCVSVKAVGFPCMRRVLLVFRLCQGRAAEVSFSYPHTPGNVNQARVKRSSGVESGKGHGTRRSLSKLNGQINNKSLV